MTKKKSWDVLHSEAGPDLHIFKVRIDTVANPRNGAELKATVLETDDWVNIIATTPEEKLLVVKQFRLGTQEMATEIPAGVMEEGEDPLDAAIRELAEETGYTTDDWTYLGWVEPNPAFLNNRCHQFLARNIVQTNDIAQDEGEDIEFCEMTLDEVKEEIRAGQMRNSLSLLTLTRVYNIWS